ncbi:LysR substrate-binding domain-containing protein [Paracoccus seriniphilus]|uniref:Transcriptional regulator, LysR family n=2 Tax=Paracoccus seriniphilus TaxID=184748 RepID=A0A239PU70_9RHOB|nr:LysR substrate-binding domain-containing protein [Paracoccus seriniphilus]WCR15371.1 LysR family transcriptional regulator [Paracoccus seriniphilus]SNT73851.1 transcriptional regulator, LysR family [Paracoccus seriniphilus]
MDRLQALKVFMAVAEAESFTAGARALGLSAPSATRAVNELERSLGSRLFTRTTRRVRLTDLGRGFAEELRDILAQLQAAEDAVSGAAETPRGQLRITSPQEFGRIYIAPLVAEFLDAYPDVSAELLLIDRTVNLVEEGYDVALRIGELPSSGLSAIRVGAVRQVVCGAPGYFARFGRPQVPADLARDHRLVVTGTAQHEWRFRPDRQTVVRFQPRLTVNSVAASIEIARQGWGLCRVLSYQVAEDLRDGRLEPVLEGDEPGPLPVHLVHPQGRRAPAKLRVLLDFAVERLRQLPALRQ